MNRQQRDALIIIGSSLVVALLSIIDYIRAGKTVPEVPLPVSEPAESKED